MSGIATFELTATDMLAAERLNFWAHCRSPRGLRELGLTFLIWFAIFGASGYRYWSWSNYPEFLLTDLTISLGAVAVPMLLRISLMPRRTRREFARSTSLHGPIEVRWNDYALDVDYPWGQARHRWSDFVRWAENASSIVLYKNENGAMFNLLPKRALSYADMGVIRTALAAHGVRKVALASARSPRPARQRCAGVSMGEER